jgi:hypothetical protein
MNETVKERNRYRWEATHQDVYDKCVWFFVIDYTIKNVTEKDHRQECQYKTFKENTGKSLYDLGLITSCYTQHRKYRLQKKKIVEFCKMEERGKRERQWKVEETEINRGIQGHWGRQAKIGGRKEVTRLEPKGRSRAKKVWWGDSQRCRDAATMEIGQKNKRERDTDAHI